MSVTTSLSYFLGSIEALESTSALWEATTRYVRSQGAVRISYHHYASDVPNPYKLPGFTIGAEGFPDDWMQAYAEDGLWERDPIVRQVMIQNRMLRWSDALEADTGSESAKFREAMDAVKLGDGYAIPLAGPAARTGYSGIGFGWNVPVPSPDHATDLQAAMQMAHLTYCRIVTARSAAVHDVTPREREVLFWIARGKSTTVIAEILSVSRHTVDTLTRRLFDKLDVADRTTAAVRGVTLGILHPPF